VQGPGVPVQRTPAEGPHAPKAAAPAAPNQGAPAPEAGAVQPLPPTLPSIEELSGSTLLPDEATTVYEPTPLEELSGSVLLDDAPSQGPAAHADLPELPRSTPGPNLGLAENVEAHARPESGPAGGVTSAEFFAQGDRGIEGIESASDDVEVTSLPRGRLAMVARAARRLMGRFGTNPGQGGVESRDERRPPWFWAAVVLPALALGAAIVALVATLTHPRAEAAQSRAESTAAADRSEAARSLPSSVPAAATNASSTSSAPVLSPCTVGGSSVTLAPSATVAAGVEARPFGEDIAIGFAADDHQAVAMRLSLGSLAVLGTTGAQSKEPIRRVRPLATSNGGLSLAVDADRKGDPLSGRRSLPIDPPLQVGAAGSKLVWARAGGPPAGTLWRLDGEGEIDALRGASEGAPGDTTTIVAFRRGNVIELGTTSGYRALAAKGGLTAIPGMGPSVGSPAVAINDGAALAFWADRASAEEPWHLRWVRFNAGEAPQAPQTFGVPPGGQGTQAMSAGLAALPGSRFLLVWTEGPASFHHVRGLTLSAQGVPVGPPLQISADGVNAGQGQPAVTPDGRGAVAFLESAEGGFRVVARPIACGSR
jgi:hypothetical protein